MLWRYGERKGEGGGGDCGMPRVLGITRRQDSGLVFLQIQIHPQITKELRALT